MSKDGPPGAAPAGAPRLPSRQAATAPAAPPGPAPPPPPPSHEDHRRELEALRAELEGERLRSQETRRRFGLEARELREAVERERQLLADQLRSKWEQQRARELHQLREDGRRQREAEIRQLLRWKEAELREAQELLQRERDAAMRQARDLQRQLAEELVSRGGRAGGAAGAGAALSGEGRAKLQEVLGKLRWEVDGEQAARIRHLKAELDLERSLFLKYILERFEGAPPPAAGPPRARPPPAAPPAPCSCPKPDKRRPRSMESLASRPESATREGRSLHGHLKPAPPAGPSQPHSEARGSPQEASQGPEQPPSASPPGPLETVEDGAQPEAPPGEDQGGPPGEEAAGSEAQQQQQRQRLEPGWLTGSHYQQLVTQDTDLVKALADLEQRCTRLKDENVLLRKNGFPEMQEKVKQLKRKNGQLSSIAKRLEEWAQKLRESSLQVPRTSVPLAWNGSEVDLSKTTLARQQQKHPSAQAAVLVTKDPRLQALQKECWELQSRLSADEENGSLDSLLRESQKEVLRLQRQIMLKNLSESLQPSKVNTGVVPPDVATQETSPPPAGGSEKPPSPKETPETLNLLVQDVESEAPTLGNGAEDTGNHHPETDVDKDGDPPLQVLKEQLAEKLRQCELLRCEAQEKKAASDYLEGQLKQVLSENARIAQENVELHEKSQGAKKIKDENAEIRLKLMQAAEDRNSAVQWSKRLEDKVENLEQVLKSMKEMEERQHQLESEHAETLLVLQRKEEEIKHLQQMQTGINRKHEEAMQILEAQVGVVENKYHSENEHFKLLSRELEQLQIKESGLLGSLLLPPPHLSKAAIASEKRGPDTQPGFHRHQNASSKNGISLNSAGLQRNRDGLESLPGSWSGLPPTEDSWKRCPREEGREEEPGTDEDPPHFQAENQGPSNLHVFLVRHSYDPFKGPNKNPEAELPLTAGEYVYIYGEMDADGFYEGELMDGRRGLIPSNLVEEVSVNDLMSFAPLEPSDICYNSNHERGFSGHSASSEDRSDSHDEDACVHPLSIRPKEGLWDPPRAVPYPENLTLIKQSSTSIIIGWDPPSMQSHWRKIHSYNIYVNADLFQNVKHGRQMKATIENLDLKLRSYRISVQSVTDVGNSDSKQCTFLVGTGAIIAPTLLKLQNVAATSAGITWLPSNSNYTHVVYLNEKEHNVTETGVYWYFFQNLTPGSRYCIRVETQVLREALLFPPESLQQTSAAITFVTPSAGPPDAPLDVQVQPSSSEEFFIVSWLPVTIDAVGSSNGVKVTGYAIYINGQKVTEVMSATAGSVSLAASQLGLFDGSWKVSVRTLSPVGESEDSVPALIPSILLKAPPLLPRSAASNQIPDLNFQEFLEYEDGHLSTKNNAPPSILSHKSMTNADPNFVVHFTSSGRESASTPLNIFQNCFPTSAPTSSPNAPNENRDGSSQHSSVGKASSEYVCPLMNCEESASSTLTALKVLPRETQLSLLRKEKLEEYSVTKNVSRIHPDNRNIKLYTMTHYASMTPEVSSHQQHFDYPGSSCLNPESSVEFEVKKCNYRNVGTYNLCLQIEPCSYFEKDHMGEMEHFCKEFSNLSVSQAKRGQRQISKTESPQIHPGDHNHVSDLSGAQEEKNQEHRMNILGQENSRSYPRIYLPDCGIRCWDRSHMREVWMLHFKYIFHNICTKTPYLLKYC